MLLKPMVNSYSSFSLTYQEHLGVWLLPPWNIFFYYQEHLFFYFSECSFSVAGSSSAPHPEVPRAVIRPLPYLHSFLGDLTIDMLRTQILFPVLTCRLNLKGMSSFLYFTSSFGCLNLKLSFRPIHFHHPQTCSFFPPNLANDNSFLVAQVKSHSWLLTLHYQQITWGLSSKYVQNFVTTSTATTLAQVTIFYLIIALAFSLFLFLSVPIFFPQHSSQSNC